MTYDIQLNVRLSGETLNLLQKYADEVGSTPSQIAREAILKEINLRKSEEADGKSG